MFLNEYIVSSNYRKFTFRTCPVSLVLRYMYVGPDSDLAPASLMSKQETTEPLGSTALRPLFTFEAWGSVKGRRKEAWKR